MVKFNNYHTIIRICFVYYLFANARCEKDDVCLVKLCVFILYICAELIVLPVAYID